jgi:hypothetical protein
MSWVYNLENEDAPTTAPRLIAICLTFATVAFLAVLLRFYVRLRTRKGLWVDDYATLSSSVWDALQETKGLETDGYQILEIGYAGLAVLRESFRVACAMPSISSPF